LRGGGTVAEEPVRQAQGHCDPQSHGCR
jgi:hypothetical protein